MTDDLTAALEEIRERHRAASENATDTDLIASQLDVPVLLAALEAVLKLHQPADRGTGAQCKGCATHVTFTRWPCPTVEAITRALTGEEAGDG